MPYKIIYTHKIGYDVSDILILFKNWIWNLKCVCTTTATGTSEGPGEVLETRIVVETLSDCSPMSQK